MWAGDSNDYAVRENSSSIKIFKNFKETKSFKPDLGAEGIFGGTLLGVRASNRLSLYNWESLELVRRIEIQAKQVYWSENGDLVAIVTEDSYYILRYNAAEAAQSFATNQGIDEDGVESALDVVAEMEETVRAGCWVGDCFIYTNSVNRLNYYVGGEIVTVSHLDRPMYLLGYIPAHNRLYLGDREQTIVSFSLQLAVLEYQTAIMRQDFATADSILPRVPADQRTRVAHFLEKQGFMKQALVVSTDSDHRFDLALQLKEMRTAYQIAQETDSEEKWKLLGDLALSQFEFGLAKECLYKARDFSGLLLLASAAGDAAMVERLAEEAGRSGDHNVAFTCLLLAGHTEQCLEVLISTGRLPEAAFFARTYLPSQVSRVVKLWKEEVAKTSQKASDALADPEGYENLFPDFKDSLKAEQVARSGGKMLPPTHSSPEAEGTSQVQPLVDREEEEEGELEEGEEDLLNFEDLGDDDLDLEDEDLLGD